MQNRVVRLAFSLKKYDHISDYYKQLHWFPLDQLIKFLSLCSMHKRFHQRRCIPLEPPINLVNLILITPDHLHHLRELFGISQRFFRYRATQWWNSLPSQFANLPFNSFINMIKSHLEHCDTLGI